MNKKVAKLDKTIKEKIRNLYVQGFDNEQGERVMYSLAELAKQFSVGQSTLYRHARNEDWKIQQDQFQAEYLSELDEKRREVLVQDSVKFDSDTLDISKTLLRQIASLIKESEERKSITPNLLSTIAEATYKVQRVAKLALGEATDNMNLNANVKDTTAFKEAMELLDEIADAKRTGNMESLH